MSRPLASQTHLEKYTEVSECSVSLVNMWESFDNLAWSKNRERISSYESSCRSDNERFVQWKNSLWHSDNQEDLGKMRQQGETPLSEHANREHSRLPTGPGKSVRSFSRDTGNWLPHRRVNNKKTNTQKEYHRNALL